MTPRMQPTEEITLEEYLQSFVDYAQNIGVTYTSDHQYNSEETKRFFEDIKNYIPKFSAYTRNSWEVSFKLKENKNNAN